MAEVFLVLSDFFDTDGKLRITENGYMDIRKLCEIVSNCHYSYVSKVDKEDLQSLGLVKALEMLNKRALTAVS